MVSLSSALLASQWHPTKNPKSFEETPTYRSKEPSWWVCEKGHEYECKKEARVVKGVGCSYCSGRKVLTGFNDISTVHPEWVSSWSPSNLLDASEVLSGGRSEHIWLCELGHSFAATVGSRERGRGCPYCSHRKLLSGFNDLATVYPLLALEWHPSKNEHLNPESVIAGGRTEYWWLGVCGHEWKTQIGRRARGAGCHVCAGFAVVAGVNDLLTTHPKLTAEWHPTLNSSSPTEFSAGSSKTAYWLCSKNSNHVWEAVISSRARGNNCPICANYRVTEENSLQSTHPELAAQWHPLLNLPLTAEKVVAGSGTRVSWICDKEHVWETRVVERIYYDTKCPECQATEFVSGPEKEISAFLTQLGIEYIQNDRKILKGKEIDIYIPEKKIGIEFNGVYWHAEPAGKSRNYHHDKWSAAKEAGVQLIQIWEDDWNHNPVLIKGMIAYKLGLSQKRTVFARKTEVVGMSKVETEAFLNQYHIQGYSSGSYYLGLRDSRTDEIVSVLVLKKESGTKGRVLNIIRYATSVNVVGGFTKLLKYAERCYVPESFITFADHTVSDGGLYENNGFIADKELPPDYMYVVHGVRKHKFGYRLKKFRDDPVLKFEEGLTERELADLNKIPRIWDAGKTRYVKYVN